MQMDASIVGGRSDGVGRPGRADHSSSADLDPEEEVDAGGQRVVGVVLRGTAT